MDQAVPVYQGVPAGRDGNLDWVVPDKQQAQAAAALTNPCGVASV